MEYRYPDQISVEDFIIAAKIKGHLKIRLLDFCGSKPLHVLNEERCPTCNATRGHGEYKPIVIKTVGDLRTIMLNKHVIEAMLRTPYFGKKSLNDLALLLAKSVIRCTAQ